ncbi:MAG: helix-turn-helix transcriptional regulator [Acidobacteria bacterium]|nr:helix-turn-helix transcriptional regulator [Acidobacteriota bacterium]
MAHPADPLRWRKRNGLTQVDAASLLGVSQPYLSLLEKGARPLTLELRNRMKTSAGMDPRKSSDDLFRAQLSALAYPGFAHVPRCRSRPRPDTLLLTVLARPDADARVVEALPWLVATFHRQFDFGSLVRQAKLQNLQNRLGFVLQLAAIDTPNGLLAIRELERARLLREDTLCWDSMPAATRAWMRANRTHSAEHWNVLTRLRAEDIHHAA